MTDAECASLLSLEPRSPPRLVEPLRRLQSRRAVPHQPLGRAGVRAQAHLLLTKSHDETGPDHVVGPLSSGACFFQTGKRIIAREGALEMSERALRRTDSRIGDLRCPGRAGKTLRRQEPFGR